MTAIAPSEPRLADPSTSGGSDSRALPRTIGPYTLFEPVGRGGMAELFLARTETELGATRLAVVKLILPAFADDPKFADMLIHEAKLAASLSHRHIVQVLDLGKDSESLYIAMEYVEGFDLNALLRKCSETKEGLPAQHALGIVADILEGLDYAHRRTSEEGVSLGIVHRDVSPSNILISYEGEVKLCDFGIAHANDLVRDDPKKREEAGEALKGKAGYMSPEHARAESLDARADVFAAGIILWELLAGRRLYKPRFEIPLLEQARRADIPEIPDKGLPDHAELERIVRRALARNREERYPSAGAFQRDLEEYLAKAGLLASRLKLGEWLASTFGTNIIEERRASERRLPKSSAPPPRSSGPVRALKGASISSSTTSVVVPAAPRIPRELESSSSDLDADANADVVAITHEESMPLFTPRTASIVPPIPAPARAVEAAAAKTKTPEPDPVSLSSPPSSSPVAPISMPAKKPDSDEELIIWAKKRGYVSFLFFFAIAVAVAVAYFLAR